MSRPHRPPPIPPEEEALKRIQELTAKSREVMALGTHAKYFEDSVAQVLASRRQLRETRASPKRLLSPPTSSDLLFVKPAGEKSSTTDRARENPTRASEDLLRRIAKLVSNKNNSSQSVNKLEAETEDTFDTSQIESDHFEDIEDVEGEEAEDHTIHEEGFEAYEDDGYTTPDTRETDDDGAFLPVDGQSHTFERDLDEESMGHGTGSIQTDYTGGLSAPSDASDSDSDAGSDCVEDISRLSSFLTDQMSHQSYQENQQGSEEKEEKEESRARALDEAIQRIDELLFRNRSVSSSSSVLSQDTLEFKWTAGKSVDDRAMKEKEDAENAEWRSVKGAEGVQRTPSFVRKMAKDFESGKAKPLSEQDHLFLHHRLEAIRNVADEMETEVSKLKALNDMF